MVKRFVLRHQESWLVHELRSHTQLKTGEGLRGDQKRQPSEIAKGLKAIEGYVDGLSLALEPTVRTLKVWCVLMALATVLGFHDFGWAQVAPEQFRAEMQSHKIRVEVLGLAAFHRFPELFPHLNDELIIKYLALHDSPKLQDIGVLRRWNYSETETILERLAQFHGKRLSELLGTQQAKLKKTIKELNRIELEQKQILVAKLDSQTQKELHDLEHWADVTDTGIARKKEMKISLAAGYEGANFLVREGDALGSLVSKYLEDNYFAITALKTVCAPVY